MRKTIARACAAMVMCLGPMAMAQQQEPAGGPPDGGQGPGMMHPPMGGPGGGQGGPGRPGGPGGTGQSGGQGGLMHGGMRSGPGMMGQGGGMPGVGMMPTPFDSQRGYIDLVDRFSKLSRDPESAGVAAVITANEIMKPKGADAAIAYFTKLLPEAKSETVKRAIRIHLIDLYRTSGQGDKALAEAEALIKTAAPDAR